MAWLIGSVIGIVIGFVASRAQLLEGAMTTANGVITSPAFNRIALGFGGLTCVWLLLVIVLAKVPTAVVEY